MEGSLAALESMEHDHGIMDEEYKDDLGSFSGFSDDDNDGDDGSCSFEDGPTAASSCFSTPESSDDGLDDHEGEERHLHDMSSIMAQSPLKKGLSKFYDGKSQSFTSLASVKALQDLPKTNRRSSCKKQKQMGTSKSYASMHTRIYSKSKTITKPKVMRPSSTSGSLMCSAAAKGRPVPPLPPQRASRDASTSHIILLAGVSYVL